MINYINTFSHKFVNSVNAIPKKKLSFDYAETDSYSFILLDKEGKKLSIFPTDEFYIVGDTNFLLTDTPIFFSDTYTIEDNIITFTVDTYTA